jgi:hypothetical protein
MTTPVHFDAGYGLKPTVGREQSLGYHLAGTFSSVFASDDETYLQRQRPKNFKVAQRTYADIEAKNRAVLRFGDQCRIEYSNELPADMIGCEMIVKLPKLHRTDGSFNSTNGNPLDAGYIGAGGSATDYLEWQPHIGEKFLGGLRNKLVQRHSQDKLRQYSPFEIHTKRKLFQSSNSSQERTIYKNGIGALVDNTNVANDLVIPIWLPWAPDKAYSLHHHMPMHAFAEPFVIEFDIPNLDELISTNIPIANISAGSVARPDIFIRNHFVVRTAEERAYTASETLGDNQIWYMNMHTVSEREVEVAASASATTVDIDVELTKLPCAATFVIAQYKDDLARVGSLATAADVDADPNTKRTQNIGGSELICRPNWTTMIPIQSWACMDGPDFVTPTRSMGYWLNSGNNFTAHFPDAALTSDVAVIPWTDFPTVEDSGTGHIDFSTMKKPRIRVTLPPNDAKNQSQVRVVRVINLTRGTIHANEGTVVPALHVGS